MCSAEIPGDVSEDEEDPQHTGWTVSNKLMGGHREKSNRITSLE